PQIYLLVLKKIGLKPEECIFIDDRKKYTDAAEKVGINGIQFRDAEQLKKELAGLSIRLGSSQNL
ncbi:MAG: HAD-IA family hydrolase, partial [Nanoarchaeota archaeon]|nr:HAD-IA family hydrolase [Nanoarchaeota archaeon]